MSRCFPYPPPGYALSSATQDALIESIKLQKDKVKAEEHKKDKKREKKERKKDKKDKKDKKEKKEKKNRIKDSSDAVPSHLEKNFKTDAEINFSQKEIKAESEQLECSSLTEEHAKPVCLRIPSSSSDSTENSNKRKRQPSPVDISRGHGKIIRIRLSSKKHSQSDALLNEEKHCSTSGRTHVPSQIENEIAAPRLRSEGFCSTSGSNGSTGQSLVFKTGGERFHIASKQIETASPPLLETKALPPVMTAMQKECLLYRNLIENWVPPQMNELLAGTGDEDWLFGSKARKAEVSETRRICRDESVSSCSSASLWPLAQYLPEVDLYALPYTVPF